MEERREAEREKKKRAIKQGAREIMKRKREYEALNNE